MRINAEEVSEYLSQNKGNKEDKKEKIVPEDMLKFYNALPNEFTTGEGLKIALENSIDVRRAERFFTDQLKFKRISHGKYTKIKSGEPPEMSVLSV